MEKDEHYGRDIQGLESETPALGPTESISLMWEQMDGVLEVVCMWGDRKMPEEAMLGKRTAPETGKRGVKSHGCHALHLFKDKVQTSKRRGRYT